MLFSGPWFRSLVQRRLVGLILTVYLKAPKGPGGQTTITTFYRWSMKSKNLFLIVLDTMGLRSGCQSVVSFADCLLSGLKIVTLRVCSHIGRWGRGEEEIGGVERRGGDSSHSFFSSKDTNTWRHLNQISPKDLTSKYHILTVRFSFFFCTCFHFIVFYLFIYL